MATARTKTRGKARDAFLLNFNAKPTRFGATRIQVQQLAAILGLNETQTIHYAISELAQRTRPPYPLDDGLPTDKQLRAIQKLAGQPRRGGKVVSSLF